MLTCEHKVVHLVVNTFEQGLKWWRGVGYLPPSHRAWEIGFDTFEKLKCIFSITPVKSLEKSQHSLNARLGRVGRWPNIWCIQVPQCASGPCVGAFDALPSNTPVLAL